MKQLVTEGLEAPLPWKEEIGSFRARINRQWQPLAAEEDTAISWWLEGFLFDPNWTDFPDEIISEEMDTTLEKGRIKVSETHSTALFF